MNGAVVVTWNSVVHGREAKAFEVFGRALAHLDQLQKEGRIHGHHEYFSQTGSGPLGIQIIDGEQGELRALLDDTEFQHNVMAGGLVAEDLTVNLYGGGDADSITQIVGQAMTVEQELGYL